MFRIVLLSVVLVNLAACATRTMTWKERTSAYNDFIQEQKLESVNKITSFRFEQWTGLGDQHLILYRRFNEPYLITLTGACYDLQHTNSIGVNYHQNTLMAKFDSISIPNGMPIKCHIKTIHKLTKAQKKALQAIGRPRDSTE